MCGRYAIWAIDDLGKRFLVVDPTLGFRSRFNIAPMTENPVVISDSGGRRILGMTWGINFQGDAGKKPSSAIINIRAESLLEKPSWSHLLREGRCIVPANGFYEWKKEGAKKIPFFFRREDNALFGFAGLYKNVRDPNGQILNRYAIITTEPNNEIRPVHDRMPAILLPKDESEWLSGSPPERDAIRRILSPYPAEELCRHRVSFRVNSPAEEGKELILPEGQLLV
jgi:putative SOS response-associated peptidase YedK